jgi:plasmid stabilization system protein ParE
MNDIKQLAAQWIAAKEAERVAIEERRTVEDEIKALVEFAEDTEGTETIKPDEYIIKIAGRIDRKVDGEKVQELAAEYGLTDHLAKLFRWKPEINMAVWKSTDESITRPLAAAITAKPGRPSFSITIKE